MDRKEIQESRMKGYFLESTKKLIRGEGLRVVSARNIADDAGYSYATLYNYFKDIKELIFLCVQDFLEECRQFVLDSNHPGQPGMEHLKSVVKSYMRYFVQYPGTYELIFLERMNNINYMEKTGELVDSFFYNIIEEDWNYCIQNKLINKKDVGDRKNLLRDSVHGLMLFYMNRRMPPDYIEYMKRAELEMELILKK